MAVMLFADASGATPGWVVDLFPKNALSDHGLAVWLVVMVVAFLFSMGVSGVFLCLRIGKFLGPKVTAVADGHVNMMNTMRENSIETTSCLTRLVHMQDAGLKTQRDDGECLRQVKTELERLAEPLEEIHDKVVVQGCDVANRRPPPRRRVDEQERQSA